MRFVTSKTRSKVKTLGQQIIITELRAALARVRKGGLIHKVTHPGDDGENRPPQTRAFVRGDKSIVRIDL